MRKHNPQLREDGFHLLRPYAHEYTQQLLDEFAREINPGLRCWLLELLSEARDPKTFPLFVEHLQSDEGSLRFWAIRGLKLLNTKEARRALWEAGV